MRSTKLAASLWEFPLLAAILSLGPHLGCTAEPERAGQTAASGGGAGAGAGGTSGAGAGAGVGGTAGGGAGTGVGGTSGGGAGGAAGGAAGVGGTSGRGGGDVMDASGVDAMRDGSSTADGPTTIVDGAPIVDAVDSGGPLVGPGYVTIVRSGTTFTLLRDGVPYYIKGFGGQTRLELAQQYGGNSTRTYTSANAGRTLDTVRSRGITLLLGIDLSKASGDYSNETYKTTKRTELANLLTSYKNHPALLMWALGNEINSGADVQAAWAFVNELAGMIHQQDPNHPVATVLAGSAAAVINNVALWAPQVDVLGINAYAAVENVDADVKSSRFAGPYVITEFGPSGHWEVANTAWMRPLEQTSAEKAQVYQGRYDYIFFHRDRALGSYVFLWGQKQERTPTWYSMFLERLTDLGLTQETCPTVDAMIYKWSGAWPVNRAPLVTAMTLNGLAATANVTLTAGQMMTAVVTATEPESDAMRFIWELLPEPTVVGTGGSAEPRPARIGQATTMSPTTAMTAPTSAGQYRLFVYVLDGQGHAGTANLPFRVQ
jgi:hypothetical protein